MLEIKKNWENISILTWDKKEILLWTTASHVSIDGLEVNFPGEYEKSEILLEVKSYNGNLYYNFSNEGNTVVYFFDENFEMKEEIMTFFWDVDVLIIRGSKESVKVFENIEARVVVAFGEGKDVFLNALGQHGEAVKSYKLKADTSLDMTEFVNLEE